MKKMLITGGAGFIGSHAAEYFTNAGYNVKVFDNLSRALLLKKEGNLNHNWDYLKQKGSIELIKGDIRDQQAIESAAKDCDVIVHTAAQTAVTTSLVDPREDFTTNSFGTFNVLEAARKNNVKSLVYCSTNKVYGHNVNNIPIKEGKKRYDFDESFKKGVPVDFSIDHCEHTPYGASKLSGDIYAQDYSHIYGIKCGVFRMSCIYGTRQFGVEDQGWVAWFVIASLLNKPITIYGDGKQVRDVLFVDDLIKAYDLFLKSNLKGGVFNTGGGPNNTLSLIELLDIIKQKNGSIPKLKYDEWRPSDQKVFVSDITLLKNKLGWSPTIKPEEGVGRIIEWSKKNINLLK